MAVNKHVVDMLIRVRDQATRKLGLIGKSTRAFGGALKYMAVGLSAYFGVRQVGSMLRFGAEFEKTMSRVGVLTRSTAADQKRLETTARRLGATTAFTAKEAAAGMSAYALAGFKVNDIMRAMPATLNLAAAGELEVGESAKIAAGIMRGMGIEANQLTGVTDALVAAFTSAQTDLVGLGEGLSYVGSLSEMAGFDLAKTTSALMILSDASIQGSRAGTTFREILSNLAKDAMAPTSKLKNLGVEAKTAEGNFKELPDIVDDLIKATSGMGRLERLAVMIDIFGKRGGPGMAAMLKRGGNALREYENILRSLGGIAEKVAAEQLDNVAGSLTKIKSALADIKLSAYAAQKGPLKNWLDDMLWGFQHAAFDIRNMQLSWDTAMTAMSLSAYSAGEKIAKAFAHTPLGAGINIARKNPKAAGAVSKAFSLTPLGLAINLAKLAGGKKPIGAGFVTGSNKLLGEGFAEDKKILQKHLTLLIAEREKKFIAELRGSAAAAGGGTVPGGPAIAPATGEEQAKKVAKVLAAIQGGTGPLESRLLTMAPGTMVDPVAKNTRDQVLEARKQRRLQAKMLRVLEELSNRMMPFGMPPPNALKVTNFQ